VIERGLDPNVSLYFFFTSVRVIDRPNCPSKPPITFFFFQFSLLPPFLSEQHILLRFLYVLNVGVPCGFVTFNLLYPPVQETTDLYLFLV